MSCKQTTPTDRKCVECGHLESEHEYSPPGYNSSDGLPTMEGCFGDGVINGGDPLDDDWAYPVPACDCIELVIPEEE